MHGRQGHLSYKGEPDGPVVTLRASDSRPLSRESFVSAVTWPPPDERTVPRAEARQLPRQGKRAPKGSLAGAA